MTDFDFADARDRLRRASEVVLASEKSVELAGEIAAEAEAFYRAQLADAFRKYREAGKGVEESNTLARGECVVHSKERDVAATRLKLGFERLEDARDSRRSLWRLIEWARARDGATAQGPAQQTWPT
jgi:hypothetical protein